MSERLPAPPRTPRADAEDQAKSRCRCFAISDKRDGEHQAAGAQGNSNADGLANDLYHVCLLSIRMCGRELVSQVQYN
jgi:hypothetical protein